MSAPRYGPLWVERDGEVASYHVANVTAKKLRPLIVQKIERASHLMLMDEFQAAVEKLLVQIEELMEGDR